MKYAVCLMSTGTWMLMAWSDEKQGYWKEVAVFHSYTEALSVEKRLNAPF